MSGYKIDYKDSKTGEAQTHNYSGTQGGAEAWTESLASEHDSKAVCTYTDRDGNTEHVVSHGSDK